MENRGFSIASLIISETVAKYPNEAFKNAAQSLLIYVNSCHGLLFQSIFFNINLGPFRQKYQFDKVKLILF